MGVTLTWRLLCLFKAMTEKLVRHCEVEGKLDTDFYISGQIQIWKNVDQVYFSIGFTHFCPKFFQKQISGSVKLNEVISNFQVLTQTLKWN